MRGDWIYDWVRVEMEYRAGPAPVVRRPRPDRSPSRHWAALWAGLFTPHRVSPARGGSAC
ncbi:hypothetical protein GCM10027258_35950 [Amycolatopsis stemonae]